MLQMLSVRSWLRSFSDADEIMESEEMSIMGTKIVYNHRAIEKKWREKWEENPVNPKVDDNGKKKPKYYCLDMFPYPSETVFM